MKRILIVNIIAMKVLDIHCHPVVKTLLKERADARSVWVPIDLQLPLVNGLESQCALDQVCDIGMNLLCLTRHTLERGMVRQPLLYVASIVPYSAYMKLPRLLRLAHGDQPGRVSYDEQLDDEWYNLHRSPDGRYPNQKLCHLTSLSEYKEENKETLYIIFNVEGGHIFNNPGDECHEVKTDNVIYVLNKLQGECPMIFYFTPTHTTPNNLINHAFAGKILRDKPFRPDSFGICPTGFSAIKEIYKRKILIDIKHMSLVSRQQFYKFRNDNGIDTPIIASHVAFTGLSWEGLVNKVELLARGRDFVKIRQHATTGIIPTKKYDPFTETFSNGMAKFNPNSINLYDEDILHVLQSGGLIGIIFDVRILGASIKESVTEFLSIPEYEEWCKQSGLMDCETKLNEAQTVYDETEDEVFYREEDILEFAEEIQLYFPDVSDVNYELMSTEENIKAKSEEHLLHFMNQLLYIAKLCTEKLPGTNPWKQICVGSDFDGLIASMYCCRNVKSFEHFADLLATRIPIEAEKAGITIPSPIDCFIEDFFYNNAYRAIEKHFSE